MTFVDFRVVRKKDGTPLVALPYEITGGIIPKKSITNNKGYTEAHWLSIRKNYLVKLENYEPFEFCPQRLFSESCKVAVTQDEMSDDFLMGLPEERTGYPVL